MSMQLQTSNAQAVVDGVLADLETNVVFPDAYRVTRYLAPGIVDPAVCPLLAVYVVRDRPVLVATGCYAHEYHLGIQWWEAASPQVEGTSGDALAMRLFSVAEAIMSRIEAWPMLAIPGIDNRWGQLEGEVTYEAVEEGYCWRSEILLGVNLEPGA